MNSNTEGKLSIQRFMILGRAQIWIPELPEFFWNRSIRKDNE